MRLLVDNTIPENHVRSLRFALTCELDEIEIVRYDAKRMADLWSQYSAVRASDYPDDMKRAIKKDIIDWVYYSLTVDRGAQFDEVVVVGKNGPPELLCSSVYPDGNLADDTYWRYHAPTSLTDYAKASHSDCEIEQVIKFGVTIRTTVLAWRATEEISIATDAGRLVSKRTATEYVYENPLVLTLAQQEQVDLAEKLKSSLDPSVDSDMDRPYEILAKVARELG